MKRLHPLVGLTRALQYAIYGLSVPFFVLAMAGNVFDGLSRPSLMFPVMGLGVLVGGAYGVASYTRYTYRITEDTFDVFSGVLARREREIPHRRIQNVDANRSVWQNLLGVATVRIETAGGGSTEAVLNFVSGAEAERLQGTLRERRAAARREDEPATPGEGEAMASPGDGEASAAPTADDPAVEPAGDVPLAGEAAGKGATVAEVRRSDRTGQLEDQDRAPVPLFVLSKMELAVHAATTFRPGVLAVLVIGTPIVEGLVTDLLLALAAPLGGPDRLVAAGMTPDEALALAVVGVPLAMASAWAIGIAFGVNQYYGFRLGQRGEELVYERGLLSSFSGTIPLRKVQTLTVTENALQRVLGYAGLSVDTAGYAGGGGQGAGNRSAIPLAERERVVTLVEQLEGADLDATMTRPPKRARERYAVRYGLVLGAVLVAAFAASRTFGGFSLWWTPALLAPAVPVLAHLKWKHRGYALGEEHLLVRSGFLRRRTQIVPHNRLQTITRSRTVFQRRRRLAHLIADTASGGVLNRVHPVAYDQPDDDMRDLQDRLRDSLQANLRESQ